MRSLMLFLATVVVSLALTNGAAAQNETIISAPMSQAEIDRIVKAFTTQESTFRKALTQYSFKRDAVVQSVGMGQQVTGEYHRVSTFTFDDSGKRYEKITFFPMPSFAGTVTPEDLEDLGGIQPFALEPAKISEYAIKYVGREKIDELNLYVFDVSPKVMPDPKKTKERYFLGRVWVDDQDLQVVKTRGKGIPETKVNKFPIVETYREQIDGKFWFPTYSYADDELVFENGESLHIRMKVKYSDFAPARADVKIIEVDEANEPKPDPSPAPPSPSPVPPKPKP